MSSSNLAVLAAGIAGSLCCIAGPTAQAPPQRAVPDHVLWYRAPAGDWEKDALPIGNGSLGGMVFGGIDREQVQFNEDTLWIGDEQDTGAYQAFGELQVALDHGASADAYRRELDIQGGVHRVRYETGGTAFRRSHFASRPAGVMVIRFEADRAGAHSGRIRLTDAHGTDRTASDERITFGGSLAGFV